MSLQMILAYDSPGDVGQLFSEYTNMLIEGDASINEYLKIQNYEDELKNLEQKYGLPNGRLYLAYYDGNLAGCIGLRKIDDENCEMKRFYVRPEFRGKRIGNQLIKKIIMESKEISYKHMLLDTLPYLENAVLMYKKYGFYEIQSYNNSPMDTSIFMRLDL